MKMHEILEFVKNDTGIISFMKLGYQDSDELVLF